MAHSGQSSAVQFDLLYKKVTWKILPWLLLGYVIAYLDRVNVGFAKLSMLNDLGMSEAAYGLGAGIFFLGYFIFEVPSNLILHRVGAKIWIARIMITWGLISSLMAFTVPIAHWMGVSNETVFYSLRFLLGASEAGFFPGVILYMTYWYPSAMHSRVMAVVLLGNPCSYILGGPISGALMQFMGSGDSLAGWQWMFLIEALPACLLGIVILFVLSNDIASAKWLTAAEKSELARRLVAENKEKVNVPLKSLYALPILWFLALVYLLMMIGSYGINFWAPTIIRDAGVKSVLDIGMISAIPYILGATAMVFITRHAEKVGKHRSYSVGVSMIAGLALVLCTLFPHNIYLTLAGIAIAVGGSLTSIALFWGFPGAYFTGATAAAGIAIINSVGNLGGFFGPYLLGALTTAFGSPRYGLMMLGGALFLAGVLIALGGRKREPAAVAAGA
ncbi:MFS transporter [Herbaspirillum rubrisubalbicans]|jgi:MFS family permease|uniref:MFS transporter n=1 Tax=Herbaspirillum rubrisubalbicans TaxID=80842 RepID=UPI00155839E3|nr:MFS transporter [Herbaspirillum rubrisubalbicans]NQE51039.1 MFS transporter [Herbaspirillum rubrisubalbicans]